MFFLDVTHGSKFELENKKTFSQIFLFLFLSDIVAGRTLQADWERGEVGTSQAGTEDWRGESRDTGHTAPSLLAYKVASELASAGNNIKYIHLICGRL